MKITDVRLHQVSGTLPFEGVFWEERLIQPIDVYPEYKARQRKEMRSTDDSGLPISSVFIEIETDEGITGIGGPTSLDVAFIAWRQFRDLLIGEDPVATERLWDIMYRSAVHGRKGEAMFAISVIDCALWDLRGKWANAPVYQLLGGPVRKEIPAYASALGYSIEPEKAFNQAKKFADEGYKATKWFVRNGPADGHEGIRKNVELIRTLREAVGPDVEIMIDAWMSWDVPYTIRMSELLLEYRPYWIEEPVMPDKIDQYAEIRERSLVRTAGGEHEYTRWGIKQLLDVRAVDFVQADTYWAGGISELQKIITLGSVYDIPVIPHGHSTPANAHLSAAAPILNVPWIEYLVKWNDIHQHFLKNPIKPVNGVITVSDRPGLDMELDPAKFETERYLDFSDL
ncbi:MAG: mandelate racemase/muconate lactonizing protein [Chloroflexia bacterium]|jgi:L-alanine-DL-glutamate epimerase-like enolase superfamily enzyme|nr:mandelate racemase/muconate lactonizing protein [Chloroflexia bacterium]